MAARWRDQASGETKRRVLARDGWQCKMPVCLAEEAGGTRAMDPALYGIQREPWAPTVDHIVRVADGGTHWDENLRGAHFACNQAEAMRADRPVRAVQGQALDLAIASRIDSKLAERLAELAASDG